MNQKRISVCAPLVLSMSVMLLSACSIVPGQRFESPPTLPETGGEYSSEPEQNVQIPITDINLKLVRSMNGQATQVDQQIASLLSPKAPTYKLGPGDVLQITVWDHPELAAALGQPSPSSSKNDPGIGFLVDADGNIQFPYAGTIHVGGKDAATVQKELYRKLSVVFQKPEVTVRVAAFRAAQVYVDGEVHAPGPAQVNDIPMSLTEAINRTGGFTPNADQSHVELVRDGKTYEINVPGLIRAGRAPTQLYLQGGDLLRVGSRDEYGIYLMGEVNKPATILPMRDGRLTLAEALSQAGSLNPNTAYAKQTFVIRNSMSDKPQIYHLDATSPTSMVLANQFNLEPKDVVYVDNNGLVKFNRVLSLLLPAINAGVTAALLAK
ncbi:EPS I polysaccharide export outer membrane protein EpsA [Paraburkholderia piptadeniae]|uniref:EPS I polysaccharide export outer membrane protein EpsA n=1 Tax=Paraburkholderia piptadeniae TaxID=1701573 RepID=A0A1N7RM02_9BURK|nr:polysaccharide biosynthesis/export family protein [Paraburkholderia piptadeniae]SIT36137.1 EPS I polysaccharide export outer membrane protein EpsA [Paraburkholderia piptadeniae]